MCTWKQPLVIVSVAMVAFAAGQALPGHGGALAGQPDKKAAQPEKHPAKPGDKAPVPGMDEMMKTMQPGPEHKVLESMVGEWEGDVKFWMAPGTEPMISHGKAKREMGLDGHFLFEHVDGDPMPGSPPDTPRFKGMSITGYNTIEKRYESAWCENMSTWIAFSTGQYDAAKKMMTLEGDMIDPMTNKRVKSRSTCDFSNPNREVLTGYGIGPDGKEFKNFEGVFERKKH